MSVSSEIFVSGFDIDSFLLRVIRLRNNLKKKIYNSESGKLQQQSTDINIFMCM